MNNGISEIDDKKFFLSKNGKINAKDELNATLNALLNETTFGDKSTACKFPARKQWLKEKLDIKDFPDVRCEKYEKILKRLNPKSATMVFPSAHINSPASMFGHTFLRINSAYKSKLLSYAINYAADADPNKENGFMFAIKGLVGGYFGKYSLLPYYEKLKEYRDSEQRDVWEYDLNLTEDEVRRMVNHIWEINGTYSYYYFFTENCSYNMLWLIELARPSVHLREYFTYQVIPLETIHAIKEEKLIKNKTYRASKRTVFLEYERLIEKKNLHFPKKIVKEEIDLKDFLKNKNVSKEQKKYILEASAELVEYAFTKKDITKDEYLLRFHKITKARASLKKGKKLNIKVPVNPLNGHKSIRATLGLGEDNGESTTYLGIRSTYHSLDDISYGFLRGTQIEYLNIELSHNNKTSETDVEKATLLSIASYAPRSEFFNNISWRTKFGWDRNYLEDSSKFMATVGAGLTWGNDLGYLYTMVDPLVYYKKSFEPAIGASLGLALDKYKSFNTNFEFTKRFYDNSKEQNLFEASQQFRLSKNMQLKFKYAYTQRYTNEEKENDEKYQILFSYYF